MKVFLAMVALGTLQCLKAQATTNDIYEQVKLWYFYGDSINNNVSLSLLEADTIKDQPGFDVDKTTVILVHGYTDSVLKPIGQVSMQAYLDNGNYNALFLDWGPLAGGLYTTAVANVVLIAQVMAVVLLRSGISFEKLHLVGHSLGGQMVGMIGANVQELTKSEEIIAIINRITGLDPAGPLFYKLLGIPLLVRQIQPTDAAFVDCIHSDAGLLGEPDACGFIDFWPNGGTRQQPDCPFVPSFLSIECQSCSHERSWEVFAASLLEADPNSFLAVEADSYLDFQLRDVTETATYNQMGINCSKNVPGNFYLQTSGVPNYSLGVAGTIYKTPPLQLL